jgi:hypothetical protein
MHICLKHMFTSVVCHVYIALQVCFVVSGFGMRYESLVLIYKAYDDWVADTLHAPVLRMLSYFLPAFDDEEEMDDKYHYHCVLIDLNHECHTNSRQKRASGTQSWSKSLE